MQCVCVLVCANVHVHECGYYASAGVQNRNLAATAAYCTLVDWLTVHIIIHSGFLLLLQLLLLSIFSFVFHSFIVFSCFPFRHAPKMRQTENRKTHHIRQCTSTSSRMRRNDPLLHSAHTNACNIVLDACLCVCATAECNSCF